MTEIDTGIEGVNLFIAPIAPIGGLSRREREKAAVDSLLSAIINQPHTLTHTPEGAPELILTDGSPAPHISVSHSSRLAAVALSRNSSIGVDIEQPRPQLSRIAPKFLAPGEQANDLTRLLRLWTAKEAVFKAAGRRELLISHISVNTLSATASTPSPHRIFSLKWMDYEDHLIALAIPLTS